MTITSDYIAGGHPYTATVGSADGVRMVLRVGQRVLGAALLLSSSGLWLMPGASFSSEVMLFKMALSILALMAGFWLVLAGQKPAMPEIEIDTVRRELRMTRSGPLGAQLVLERVGFAELSKIERRGPAFSFWDQSGRFIVDIQISDRRMLETLLSALRDSGKAI